MMIKDGMPVACFRCASWNRNPDVKVGCVSYAARDGRCGVSVQVIKDVADVTHADFYCDLFVENDAAAF